MNGIIRIAVLIALVTSLESKVANGLASYPELLV